MSDLVIDLTSDPLTAERLAERLPREAEFVSLGELRARGPLGAVRALRRKRYRCSVVVVNAFRIPTRWLVMMLLALLPRARRRSMMDRDGSEWRVSWRGFLGSELPFVARRARITRRVCRVVNARVGKLGAASPSRGPVRPRRIAFIRPDLGPPLTAGGSVAHIRGVIAGFERHGCSVTFVTPAEVSGIDAVASECFVIPADPAYGLSVELPHLAYNETFLPPALEKLGRLGVDLVYQRHALGSYTGAALSRALNLPLVIEFNGPEVWIARNWGAARTRLNLFEEIERRTLLAADLVVAVSEPLRRTLRDAGVPEDRILINPNGVDIERYDAGRLATARDAVRRRYDVAPDEIVVVFLGTFGPWHGAEVLAEAACRVPEPWSARLRYLFIGDGVRRESTISILKRGGLHERSVFTGLVPHDETPELLAAGDLCVSPHVPNPDGSAFFGSPTKLFEYLASGVAVLASDLGQIGEVLEHGRTAWLVPPGDAGALADGMVHLAGDGGLRSRLGAAAREDATRRFSWTAHVERVLQRLARGRTP